MVPSHRPTPKPLRTGPWRRTASTRTNSHTTHRQAAILVFARGSRQARSQTRAMTRLKLVAEASATTRPTTPVV